MDADQISAIIANHLKNYPDRKQLRHIANSYYKVFLSDTAPVPNLEVVKKYIGRVLTRCHIYDEQILQAYMLILKFCYLANFSINPYSWQRLITVSFYLLNKYFNDRYVWAHQIAYVGQFEDKQFVEMEILFSQVVEFDFYYNEESKSRDLLALKQQGVL